MAHSMKKRFQGTDTWLVPPHLRLLTREMQGVAVGGGGLLQVEKSLVGVEWLESTAATK